MEKNKLLEKSVKQLEEQLSKTEQLYKELEKQYEPEKFFLNLKIGHMKSLVKLAKQEQG